MKLPRTEFEWAKPPLPYVTNCCGGFNYFIAIEGAVCTDCEKITKLRSATNEDFEKNNLSLKTTDFYNFNEAT